MKKKKKYSPFIQKNIKSIEDFDYMVYSNGYQLYKDFNGYEVLITDYSLRPFVADIWYIVNIDIWIKDSRDDMIVKTKKYSGGLWFPKLKKIDRYLEKTIIKLKQESG